MRCTAIAWTGGWVIPEVCRVRGACAASAEQAQRFASASALRTQRVEPLPEPPRPASGGSQFTTDNMSPN